MACSRCSSAPLRAGSEEAATPEWEFSLAPYLWMAGLEGTVEADRLSADVDVSFSDIWDELDIGVLAAFEARRGKFSVTTNAIYLKLSPEAGGRSGRCFRWLRPAPSTFA